jgi:hypothetical protein
MTSSRNHFDTKGHDDRRRTVTDGGCGDSSDDNLAAMPTEQQPSMIERIERALVVLAYLLDGDVHLPLYEKFEAELEELKRKEDTKARARKLLLSYASRGGLKAIR